jgi:hypothetical protein
MYDKGEPSMRNTTLAIYRLPIPTATQIGHVRVVIDRRQQVYLAGSKIVTATPSGDFLILTAANDQTYYVKIGDYQNLHTAPKRRR